MSRAARIDKHIIDMYRSCDRTRRLAQLLSRNTLNSFTSRWRLEWRALAADAFTYEDGASRRVQKKHSKADGSCFLKQSHAARRNIPDEDALVLPGRL